MSRRRSIIVDIDGTLANIDHRLHHIGKGPDARDVADPEESKKVDWDAFHAECGKDLPIKETCALVRSLGWEDNWCVIMMTGRGSENREETESWLKRNDLPYDLLLMREAGNHDLDVDIKRNWLRMMRIGQISIPDADVPSIVIEDRARVIKMWREEGLVALQCDMGEF